MARRATMGAALIVFVAACSGVTASVHGDLRVNDVAWGPSHCEPTDNGGLGMSITDDHERTLLVNQTADGGTHATFRFASDEGQPDVPSLDNCATLTVTNVKRGKRLDSLDGDATFDCHAGTFALTGSVHAVDCGGF